MPWNTVLFDLDGTLTNPAIGITRCIQHALQSLGEEPPAMADLLWCIGPPLRASFVQLVGEERADAGVALYRERFGEVGLFENEVHGGIPEILSELQQRGRRLLVATSKPTVYASQICDRFFPEFALQVYGSELDGTRGDKGELLHWILAQEGLAAGACVMIGDRSHDIVGAAAAEVASIGVLWGFGSRQELHDAGARRVVETPAEILEFAELT